MSDHSASRKVRICTSSGTSMSGAAGRVIKTRGWGADTADRSVVWCSPFVGSYVFDAAALSHGWAASGEVVGSPAVANGVVHVSSSDDSLFSFTAPPSAAGMRGKVQGARTFAVAANGVASAGPRRAELEVG